MAQLKEMKLLFDAGALASCYIKHAVMQSGYILVVQRNKRAIADGGDAVEHLHGQRDLESPRTFKTIDAAVSTAREIGFRKVSVEIDW